MNPFLLPLAERLTHWKEFRKSMVKMDDVARLNAVAEYWAKAPLMTIAYDPSDAATWPTPWEMIRNNEWCRCTVAIGMENTLRLAGFPTIRTMLNLILDRDIQEMLLVLIIDGTWVLNYDWGSIVPYPKTDHCVLKSWRYEGKAYTLLNGK